MGGSGPRSLNTHHRLTSAKLQDTTPVQYPTTVTFAAREYGERYAGPAAGTVKASGKSPAEGGNPARRSGVLAVVVSRRVDGRERRQHARRRDGRPCPVTLPHPVDPRQVDPNALCGSADSYGNGKLWVGGLWPGGVIAAGPDFVDADGAVDMKLG
jgi:hypothetical protein